LLLSTLSLAEVGGCSANFPRLETTAQQTAAISVEATPTAPALSKVAIEKPSDKILAGYRQSLDFLEYKMDQITTRSLPNAANRLYFETPVVCA